MITKAARQFIVGGDNFLISTHINSDGDAIGASLAMSEIIRQIGKKSRIILHDNPIDSKYKFLWGFDQIESYDRSLHKKQASKAILLDTPAVTRIGDVANLIGTRTTILNIDHHRSNTEYGSINIVDENACATSELIYQLAKSLKVIVGPEMAMQLYTGIMFDTGRFRYSNLHRAFPIAAMLARSGAQPEWAAEAVYSQKSYKSIKILGEALASLRLYSGNRVAVMNLPYKAIKGSNDLDGIVDYAISISEVEVAVLMKEQKPGQVRVSLRSRGKFDVNDLARGFQGGGHPNAAGFCITCGLNEARKAILKAIGKRLKN